MSKIVKVKVKMEKIAGGGTHNKYPQGYDASKISVLAYGGSEETIGNFGYCIGIIKDEDLSGFLQTEDIKEISIEEANIFGRKYRKQVVKVLDQGKVLEILAKNAIGGDLTEEEKDIINPDKEAKGLNKSKLFNVENHI